MRIIYIDVDSLRPDHTSPYGYARKLTPNIQSIADKGVRFDEYHSSDTPCMPSRGAMTTQRFGVSTGIVGHQANDGDLYLTESRSQRSTAPFLGFHLANTGGYHTVGMTCFAERHQAYWFHGNFMEFLRPSLSLGIDEDAADVADTALDWLDRRGTDDKWFLMLNFWDAHRDYQIDRATLDRAAESGPAPEWPDAETIAAHQDLYGAATAQDLHGAYGDPSPNPEITPHAITDRADFEQLINGYDGAISYIDHHIGRILAKLKELGIEDDTAIVFTADHGEAFGEHGIYGEHAYAHPATTRVPLIVHWPGVTDDLPEEKRAHDGLFYHLDFGPTLCDMLGLPTPEGWHGKSFAPVLRGEDFPGRDHLILSQGVHTFQRAVRKGDLLYIRTLHPGTYKAEPEALYDLAKDPHMTRDLMPEQPELAAPLKADLADWWFEYAGRPTSEPDKMQQNLTRGPVLYSNPELYLERLESSGRHDLAADYRKRLSGFLKDPHAVPAHEMPKPTPI